MKTVEEQLKELILARYNSVREFTLTIDMPYTTMDSIFKRGIGNSSVSNIIKICNALNISADELAEGRIQTVNRRPPQPINDRIEVKDVVSDTRHFLKNCGFVTLDGKPVDKETIDTIIFALEVGVEIAKKKIKA